MINKRYLFDMAKKGDVEGVFDFIRREIHFPFPPLHTIDDALHDLRHFLNEFGDERNRAKILESLVETIFPGDDIEWRRDFYHMWRYLEREEGNWHWDLHHFAHIWYDVYRETLDLVAQVEKDELRWEALLSLTRAFGIWFPFKVEDIRRFRDRDFRWEYKELFYYIERFIHQIHRSKSGYAKAKALEILSKVMEILFTARERDIPVGRMDFRDILHLVEEIPEEQIEVERLFRNINEFLEEMPIRRVRKLAWLGERRTEGTAIGYPKRREEPPPVMEPPSRYADFTFLYGEGDLLNQKLPEGFVLQAKKWYQLEVAVRVKPIGIPPELRERRVIREPKQKKDVTIMVAAEGDGFEIEEPVQTLTLPPIGDSIENALFRVRPLSRSANSNDLAAIKIRMYYEFNLLEVAIIRAEVVGKFDSTSQSLLGLEKPITFRQERLEREYLDLDNIQPRAMHIDITKQGEYYLFNFAFYNDINRKLVFTAPSRLSAEDLEDALVNIRNIWYDIALSRTFTEKLEGDKDDFIKNIRSLAKAGSSLWIKLFKYEQEKSMYKIGKWLEKHPIKQDDIVQISLSNDSTNFVFPWDLIYDRSLPKKEYELPAPEGFWGIRYCIEQQPSGTTKGTDEPIHLKKKLRLEFMLWHQFRNARDQIQLMQYLMEQSKGKFEVSTPPIDNPDSCYKVLNDCKSHILYFYTHGYTRHRKADIGVGPDFDRFLRRYENLDANSPCREINRLLYESIKKGEFEPERSWIELSYGKIYLDDLYDKVEKLKSNPLVILNMCESAQITPSLSDSFIHFFLDRGAKGVVGTECPMTIEFAHPFAEKFLTDILAGEKIGIVLLNARRHFLALKNPLGLAYTLFGSATLCYQPPRLKK